MSFPSGLNCAEETVPACFNASVSGWPVRASQTRAVWSRDAATIRLPSGLNCADSTPPTGTQTSCVDAFRLGTELRRLPPAAVVLQRLRHRLTSQCVPNAGRVLRNRDDVLSIGTELGRCHNAAVFQRPREWLTGLSIPHA